MLLGLLLIAIAAASWGTTGATMTLLSREAAASPLLVGWCRLAVAAPLLVLTAAIGARLGSDPSSRRPWPSVADLPLCAALGVAMAAYQVCYFRAVTLVGVAVAALLAICSAPLLIAVLAAAFLGERLTPMVRLSLGMAVAGTALLVVGPRGLGDIAGHFGLGAVLALGAGVSYAVYAVAAKGLLARVAPFAVAAVTFALAALVLAPEGFAALAAARANRVQTSLNLAIGSALASIGLTIPAVAVAALIMGFDLELGLSMRSTVLLGLTLLVATLTLSNGRTTVVQGVVHLVIFATYLFTTIFP